jgi:hypothetical protein
MMQETKARTMFIFQSGLDNDLLADLYEYDYGCILQAFQIYVEELPANIAELEKLFRLQNISSLQKMVHRLKPGFNYVGISQMDSLVRLMEHQSILDKHFNEVKPYFDEFITRTKDSVHTIENEKNRLRQFLAQR